MANTWGSLAWSIGNFGAQDDATVEVTGASLTSALSSTTVTATVDFGWSNNSWGETSWNTNQVDANAFPTGFPLSAVLSEESVTGEINVGWGRNDGWNTFAWGIGGTVLLTGEQATATLDSVTTQANADVDVTGQPLTITQGEESIEISFEIDLIGQPLTANLGNVDPAPDAVITGQEATMAQGDTLAYNLEGWGRYLWGEFVWGATGIWANVDVTGIEMSSNAGTITATGDAEITLDSSIQFIAEGNAQLSTAQAKFGSASLLLDGTDDSVDSTTNLDLSSGDFTVDVWIRPDNVTGYKGIWQSGTSTTEQSYLLGNQVYWTVTPSTIITSSVTVNANEWTMLSYERQGNTHRIYKNGTLEDTATTANKQDNGPFTIGKNGFGDFDGYIDELRVSDIARYEGSSFTEPTSEFSVDLNTIALLHFNGANGSTDILNAVPNNAFEMTAAEGNADADPDANVIGQEATMTLNSVTTTADANLDLTGIALSADLGNAELDANTLVDLTGFGLTAALNSVQEVNADAFVIPTGIGLSANEGSVFTLIWNEVQTDSSAIWTEIDTAA